MAKIEKITVNGKIYQVQRMSVLDTLYFQAKILNALGAVIGDIAEIANKSRQSNEDGRIDIGNVDVSLIGAAISKVEPEKLKPIEKEILEHVITPTNKFLADEMIIETWFANPENTGDVWEVIVKGAIALLGEYLPPFLKQAKEQAKTAE